MSLSLTLYTFEKRQNSTAIPSAPGAAVEVTLKNGASMNSPVFLLSGARPSYTYAQFEGAYYFIDDIRSVRHDLYELYCRLDVLATHRAQIFDTSAYVIYRTGGSRNIADRRIAPLVSSANKVGSVDIGLLRSGHYNIAITGRVGVSIWQVGDYVLNTILSNIQNWADNLVPVDGDIVATLGNGLRQIVSQGSAMDCIRSCKWVPFDVVAGESGQIWCGNYDTGLAAIKVITAVTQKVVNISIPFNNSGFLRLPPFCDVLLYLPFVGTVNISHPRLADANGVDVLISIDNRSGDIAYQVVAGGAVIGCYGASTAVDIPVGISNVSPLKVAQSVTATAAAAAGGGALAAGALAVGAADCLTGTPNSVGGIQGGAGAGLPLSIQWGLIEHGASGAIGNMDAVQGTPCFNTVKLGDISGYVQTQGASVSGSIRGIVRDQINAILDSGAFME